MQKKMTLQNAPRIIINNNESCITGAPEVLSYYSYPLRKLIRLLLEAAIRIYFGLLVRISQ
jgi:hypothetical protein